MQIEHEFTCPYCFEKISMLIDPTEDPQAYVEDCEVCCNPIAIACEVKDGEIIEFEAFQID
ncbi:MAG: CPXCG motif-containing cysteine-rich protein [Ignavibacteria bacterium]|jgi:hypothetical protein|nr:CPXCG motif-containing cysteine-rich protein [Ignavibacteria bacterium]